MSIPSGSPVDLHSASTVGGQAFWHAGNFTPGNYAPLASPAHTGDVNAVGSSVAWGATPTVGYRTIMGTASAATWLCYGTSNGTLRGGIQLLDNGNNMRLYAGAHYLELSTTGINYDGTAAMLVSGGTFTGAVTFNSPITNASYYKDTFPANNAGIMSYGGLNAYSTNTSSVSGFLCVTIAPAGTATLSAACMLVLKVRGFNYLAGTGAWDGLFGGYTNASWTNKSAMLLGNSPVTSVDFSTTPAGTYVGGNSHIVLNSGTIQYPKLVIEELIAAHSGYTADVSASRVRLIMNVTVATTAALPACTATATTLTANAVGALTVDGVAISSLSHKILVKDEVAPQNNGVYTVTTVGDAVTAWVLTRDLDMNAWSKLYCGGAFATAGTANINKGYVTDMAVTGTLGTTPILYQQLTSQGNVVPPVFGDSTRSNNFNAVAVNGNGLRFWNGTSTYSVHMSASTDATYGGRVAGETTSDYNMYFVMAGGSNRGWVWKTNTNNTSAVAGLDSLGNFRTIGGIFGTSLTVDPGSGSANGIINLVGRNAGVANTAQIVANWNGGLTITPALADPTMALLHPNSTPAVARSIGMDFQHYSGEGRVVFGRIVNYTENVTDASNSAGYFIHYVRRAGQVVEAFRVASTGLATITTAFGNGTFGPSNNSWFHMSTDRANFYMNKGLHTVGGFTVYGTSYGLSSTGGLTATTGDFTSPVTFNGVNQERYVPNHGLVGAALTPANTGPRSLLWNAIGAARAMYMDEEFEFSSNSVGIYNSSGGGAVTVTREADATAPNKSGYRLKVYYDGVTAPAPSPGLGGFILQINPRANAVIAQRFIAKLPAGFTFMKAENSQGNNYQTIWLTPVAGTGKWEEYIRLVYCGDSGVFNPGGHVYVQGTGTFTCYIASINIYDLHSAGALRQASPMRWFYDAAVQTTDKQPAYRCDRPTVVRAIRHQSQTPGTGTLMIKVNGTNQWSITLAGTDSATAWMNDYTGLLNSVLAAGDSVTCTVTGNGTAAGVTVQIEMEAALHV